MNKQQAEVITTVLFRIGVAALVAWIALVAYAIVHHVIALVLVGSLLGYIGHTAFYASYRIHNS